MKTLFTIRREVTKKRITSPAGIQPAWYIYTGVAAIYNNAGKRIYTESLGRQCDNRNMALRDAKTATIKLKMRLSAAFI